MILIESLVYYKERVQSTKKMKERVKALLREKFPNAIIVISGDDHHVILEIEDTLFNELSRLQQHKLIYEVLGSLVGNELHALSLKVRGINKERTINHD